MPHPVIYIFIAINVKKMFISCLIHKKRIGSEKSNIMTNASWKELYRIIVKFF